MDPLAHARRLTAMWPAMESTLQKSRSSPAVFASQSRMQTQALPTLMTNTFNVLFKPIPALEVSETCREVS